MNDILKMLNNSRSRLLSLGKAIKGYNDIIDSLERICFVSSGGNCGGMRRSGTSDPVFKIVAKIETLRKKRDDAVIEYGKLTGELDDLFEALPDKFRAIMLMHYIGCYSWEKTADLCDVSLRSIYRLRNKAIKMLSGKI